MPVTNRKELQAHEIEAEVAREEAAKRIRPSMRSSQREPQRLSDDEILAKYEEEFQNDFELPPAVLRDFEQRNMVPAWKALDGVMGKPDPSGAMRILRAGFVPVQAETYPNIWTQEGHKGPIVHKGLTLCEMPAQEDYYRRRFMYLKAKGQVREKQQQINDAPDRQNKKIKMKVESHFENPGPVEFE